MGTNTFIGSYYTCALRCAAEMARWMQDPDLAAECTARADLSRANHEAACWREAYGYYVALIDGCNVKANATYADGCMTDQLIGQFHATQLGMW